MFSSLPGSFFTLKPCLARALTVFLRYARMVGTWGSSSLMPNGVSVSAMGPLRSKMETRPSLTSHLWLKNFKAETKAMTGHLIQSSPSDKSTTDSPTFSDGVSASVSMGSSPSSSSPTVSPSNRATSSMMRVVTLAWTPGACSSLKT